MSIITSRRVTCDTPGCASASHPLYDWPAVHAYLAGTGSDGRWYVAEGTQRTICRGCIIDRACRIFGHEIVQLPPALDHSGSRFVCTRCQTYQDAS